ncbi:MAG: O-acetyl-ADP-ribose deacetylase [Actinomycetota bacterium]|nr:O-acetyl-ADP-ribose deacetylase [Actinomycetota bacterium]
MESSPFVVEVGDIVHQRTDAIVNAANSSLMGGGGVDGAIHRHGGPAILAECMEIRRTTHPEGLPPGQAVATSGGNLSCRWIIHTVGPVFRDPSQFDLLASCYHRSLLLAADLGARSISFPLVGAGVYGWPADLASRAAIDGAARALDEAAGLSEVRFVLYRDELAEVFRSELGRAPS